MGIVGISEEAQRWPRRSPRYDLGMPRIFEKSLAELDSDERPLGAI